MTEEAPVQQTPGSGGGSEGNAPPTQTPPTTEDAAAWRNMIPKEFRDDPSLKPYKDFGAFVKSHVHLNKLLGAEPRVPPKDADPDVWARFYTALGRPDTPDAYNIPLPEREVSPKLLEGYRNIAHQVGLTASQAAKIAEWHFQALAAEEDDLAGELAAFNERVERELKREYGQAYDGNIRLAKKFAEDFGGKELLEWFERTGEGSNPVVIRAFVKAARSISEDRLGTSRPSSFAYTPAEAQAEIGRLRIDAEFNAAYHDNQNPGHSAAVERMRALHEAAYPTEAAP